MSDDKRKSPLVTGNTRKADETASTDGPLETGAKLPKTGDPTTSPSVAGRDLNADPVTPGPSALGETPLPTERSLRADEQLGGASASGSNVHQPSYPRPSDQTRPTYSSSAYGTQGTSGNDTSDQDMSDEARQKAQQARREAEQRARQAKRGFSKLMDDQPLVLGLVAALIGVLVGLVLPGTRREDELMGEASDNTVERAKEVAQKTFESAKETVKEEAQRQGLTPESLKQEVQDKVQKVQGVAQKAAEEAQKTAEQEAKRNS